LLAEIDPRVYQAQVEAGEAKLNSLRAQLNEQKAQAVLAEQNLKRNQNLIAVNAVSQQALQETESQAAVAKARKDDVPLLYWTAASWGSAISLGIDRPDLAVDFPTVRALADRALALDPAWSRGSIHELMITLDSLPEALGGNPARAREHFKTAVEIQKGLSPGPYVSLATGVAVPSQDRQEYERLLTEALAIDPEKDPSNRLVTLVYQRRARVLLDRIDEKFSK